MPKSVAAKPRAKVSQKRLAAIEPEKATAPKKRQSKKNANPDLEKAKKKLQTFREKQKQYKGLVKDTTDYIKSLKLESGRSADTVPVEA
jgi:hypothetical protein